MKYSLDISTAKGLPVLTCRQGMALVTDYMEGQLPFLRRLGYRMHLALCPGCRTYLEQMRQTVELLGRIPPEPVPDKVKKALLECFRNRKARYRQ